MNNAVLYAARAGYSPQAILHSIGMMNPKYKKAIDYGLAAGYTAESLMDHFYEGAENGRITPKQQYRKNIDKSRRSNTLALLGTAAAVGGAAAYGLSRAPTAAIRPSQIIGHARRTPPPAPRTPRGGTLIVPPPAGLPGPQAQLPAPRQALPPPVPQRAPRNPPSAKPSGPTIAPPYEHDPAYNVSLVKNMGLDKKLGAILGSGLRSEAAEQVIRETFPKSKLAILEKAEGGLTQLLEDYSGIVQKDRSRENKKQALSKFNEKLQKSLVEQERERFDNEYAGALQPSEPEGSQIAPLEQDLAEPESEFPVGQPIAAEDKDLSQGTEKQSLDKKVQEAVYGDKKPPKIQDVNLRKESFSIADYKQPNEDNNTFQNRKMIYNAVNKTAKHLMEHESFMDVLKDIPPEQRNVTGMSTAADVLRFLAGIPNPYDPLLDEDEKQEIFDALMYTGNATIEGLRPGKGERNVYGAPMSPNLVWNLLLAVEPKLRTTKIPRLTGFESTKDNQKMRRMLTHSVYGVLSGQRVSTQLADKIAKISRATSGLDIIASAAKAGNTMAMAREMERLMDDEEFAAALSEVMGEGYIDPSIVHQTSEKEAMDKENVKYFKGRESREKKKKEKLRED